MGAEAGIGGTYGVMPELFLKANEAIEKGDIALARKIQYKINDIIFGMVKCEGHLYDVIKAILAMNGLNVGSARGPLPRISEKDQAQVKAMHDLIEEAKKEFK
ncbi:N-acetylneuraminate lyase [bioreactor metagenome]|uniref:N-acetylneuraminate lyase n=2 Tax=root TaxID=1 RepID=A0A644XXZ5_9ZZZZ